MAADGVEVGIVLDPLLEAEAVRDGFVEAFDGLFGAAELRIVAGDVIEDAGVVGLDGQSPASPFQGTRTLARRAQATTSHVEGSGVVRV